MLGHKVTSCLNPPFLEPNSKMWLVNFRLLTSSRLVFNCLPQHVSRIYHSLITTHPLFPPQGVGAEGVEPRFFFFSESFLITSALAWLSEDCLFIYSFIRLFIYSISIFHEPFNFVTTSLFTCSCPVWLFPQFREDLFWKVSRGPERRGWGASKKNHPNCK